jgi:hypothetical protein
MFPDSYQRGGDEYAVTNHIPNTGRLGLGDGGLRRERALDYASAHGYSHCCCHSHYNPYTGGSSNSITDPGTADTTPITSHNRTAKVIYQRTSRLL